LSRSQFLRTLTHGLLAALLGCSSAPLLAADQLLVRFSGLELPLDLEQLEAWAVQPKTNPELGPWLNLLDPQTRSDLQQILRQPLDLQGSTIPLLLESWAGRQLILKLGTLLRSAEGEGGPILIDLLQDQGKPTVVSLLRKAPSERLELDLDALSALGVELRGKLQRQKDLLQQLRSLDLTPLPPELAAAGPVQHRAALLPVAHRPAPLQVKLWWPAADSGRRQWVLLSHGLGGSSAQMAWLGRGLAARGWPVLAVQHPGSDDLAVQALLEGRQTLPGLETLPARLADLAALEAAVSSGRLRFGPTAAPERLVLVGHSLGGLAGLLWAGAAVEAGLKERCAVGLRSIPVLDSSFLLQCQLSELPLPQPSSPRALDAVVVMNSFGSLLWGQGGLTGIDVPVLSIGGSLDLITPPLTEQLRPFAQFSDRRSRFALVEGGSHFSPVGISRDEALMQLSSDLVGRNPADVQQALLQLQLQFLSSLEQGHTPADGVLLDGAVRTYVLDREAAAELRT
jgi:predicted dienelactone hydrolase